MSEQKKMMKIKYTGGIHRQRFYRGDGLLFDLQSEGSLEQPVEESKGIQLLTEHPELFKLAGNPSDNVKKSVTDYRNKMIETAPMSKDPEANVDGEVNWDKPEWKWKREWMSRFLTERNIDHNPNSQKKVLWDAIKKHLGSSK